MPYNQKDAEQSLKRLFPEEYEKIQSNKSYYQRLNESKVGQALDWIDLGLDVASIIPGPIGTTAAVAGTVTGIPQGLLAIGDGFTKGWNAQNISDSAKILPGGAITGIIAKKDQPFLENQINMLAEQILILKRKVKRYSQIRKVVQIW